LRRSDVAVSEASVAVWEEGEELVTRLILDWLDRLKEAL
jgi:hypothetical protein